MLRFFHFVSTASAVLTSQGKQCGTVLVENPLNDRVIGGHVAQKRNWPWLVEILVCSADCFHCTGTIVSDRHVLTAAHCFEFVEHEWKKRPKGQTVAVRINFNSTDEGAWDDKTNVIAHPKYDYVYGFPDYDENDQPICVADSFRENIGEVGYVVGYGSDSVKRVVQQNHTFMDEDGKTWNYSTWGVTYNDPDGEPHENIVQFRTIERCASMPLRFVTLHPENTICAVGNKRDTAIGDSGGPLTINRNGVWYQVGDTSIGSIFEDDDNKTKWYALYKRLSTACDWIAEVTEGHVKCVSMDD